MKKRKNEKTKYRSQKIEEKPKSQKSGARRFKTKRLDIEGNLNLKSETPIYFLEKKPLTL